MDYELSSCSSSSSDEFIKTLLRSEEEEEVIHYIRRPSSTFTKRVRDDHFWTVIYPALDPITYKQLYRKRRESMTVLVNLIFNLNTNPYSIPMQLEKMLCMAIEYLVSRPT